MRLSFLTKQLPQDQKDRSSLEVYGCLTGVALLFVLARTFILLSCFLRCSERLHDKMVVAILKAPVMFFDSNPVGRILNRFLKILVGWTSSYPKRFSQRSIDRYSFTCVCVNNHPDCYESLAIFRTCTRPPLDPLWTSKHLQRLRPTLCATAEA